MAATPRTHPQLCGAVAVQLYRGCAYRQPAPPRGGHFSHPPECQSERRGRSV